MTKQHKDKILNAVLIITAIAILIFAVHDPDFTTTDALLLILGQGLIATYSARKSSANSEKLLKLLNVSKRKEKS